MRTEAFLRPATSCAIVLAAILAAAAIGAPGPALAACGVSSGSSTGIHPAGASTGVHVGATGSTHGVSSSSCPTRTNTTVTANVAGGGLGGIHPVTVKTGVIHQNAQTNNLQKITHTGSTNIKSVRVAKKT